MAAGEASGYEPEPDWEFAWEPFTLLGTGLVLAAGAGWVLWRYVTPRVLR